jgi:hypothetical protein
VVLWCLIFLFKWVDDEFISGLMVVQFDLMISNGDVIVVSGTN